MSTGPKTSQGKARSSLNALKHGLTSRHPVQPGEDSQLFLTFYQAMLADLNPQTKLESLYAIHLIHAAWRCRRLDDYEAQILQSESDRLAAEDQQKWESANANSPSPPPRPINNRTTSDVFADAFQCPLPPPRPIPGQMVSNTSPLLTYLRYLSSAQAQYLRLSRQYRPSPSTSANTNPESPNRSNASNLKSQI